MVYLNQAGTSWPKPAPVRAAVADALAAAPETWAAQFATAHRDISRAFGVPDPSRLLLTPGCTSALAVAVADHPWQRGDRVIISGLEHHALYRPVHKLSELGVDIVVAPRTATAPVVLEAVEAELKRGRVRLVAVSAASNVTGELIPIAEIASLARAYGALCLVDAAQVAGWIPLDVIELGVDLLAFAGHKALQAPWGIGGLFVAQHVTMTSPAATCELGAKAPMCAPMAGYCDVGSVDRAALAGLAAGLRWLGQPARAARLPRARALMARLAQCAAELPEVTIHGPADPAARVPTLAMTVAGRSPGALAAELAARGVVASGGLQCASLAHETLGTAPEGVLRLSVGPANDDAEISDAIEVLRAILT